MKPHLFILILPLLLGGCFQPPQQQTGPAVSPTLSGSDPVEMLNAQIEQFNFERPGQMGVSPIERRVHRVEYVAQEDVVRCLDATGTELFTMRRQEDGRFRGEMQVEFHQLPDSAGHEWGWVTAEFFLDGKMFSKRK